MIFSRHCVEVASQPHGPLGGVGETALGAAEMRAEESLRPDRLFDDPYAAAFVAAAPPLFPDMPSIADDPEIAALKEAFSADIVVRTRFYDEYLATACASVCRQVVLLAAGLDTRAFRLAWPTGVRIFELDLPEVLAFKDEVLDRQHARPRCSRVAIGVDLRADWSTRLLAAGFDPNARAAWMAEGLLAYLSNDDALRLLTVIGELSASGSRLSCERNEFASGSALARARTIPAMHELASMWDGGPSEDAAAWLRRHRWTVQTYERSSLAAEYGRPTPRDSGNGFLIATRLE
jgi:methyltransferase (TIGR00027 family)